MSAVVINADALDALKAMDSDSADGLLSDPPCGIGFMSLEWDKNKGGRDAWIAWLEAILREAMRVLKPGAHALIWSLPRTSHWTGMAIELAGFEVRDCIQHLFATGFPKSLDVSKAIDKAAGDDRPLIRTETRFNEPSGLVNAGQGVRVLVERKITSAAAPMVRAILAGTKTQTRRPLKPTASTKWLLTSEEWADSFILDPGNGLVDACPFGKPGDRLWVRETFAVPPGSDSPGDAVYRADIPEKDLVDEKWARKNMPALATPWTPSIHMPRWASRLTLEVTGVRVERLQDIKEQDAIAEGVSPPSYPESVTDPHATLFLILWEGIYGAGSTSVVPWVWVVEFRRAEAARGLLGPAIEGLWGGRR